MGHRCCMAWAQQRMGRKLHPGCELRARLGYNARLQGVTPVRLGYGGYTTWAWIAPRHLSIRTSRSSFLHNSKVVRSQSQDLFSPVNSWGRNPRVDWSG